MPTTRQPNPGNPTWPESSRTPNPPPSFWAAVPDTTPMDLSIVIPAYNESRRIVPTLASIIAELQNYDLNWEIIVSDDGSTDDTAAMVESLDLNRVRVEGDGINRGKGAAVRRGLLASRGRAVLFTDADMSTPIDQLRPMLENLWSGADIVIGSRAVEGADVTAKSPLRQLMSNTLHLVINLALPLGVEDSQCGFKLFTRPAAHALADVMTIDGFSFDLELLHVARRWGYRVVERPVEWHDAPGSKIDPMRESARFLRDIAKIRFKDFRGRYRQPKCADGLDIAVVTTFPPSLQTLNEYGLHLVGALASKPEIRRVTVWSDQIDVALAPVIDKTSVVPTWQFDSLASTWHLIRAARRERPDVVLFNLQFASFGQGRFAAALGLLAPAAIRMSGTPTVVLLHNLVDTVDLEQAGYSKSGLMTKVYSTIGWALTKVILRANLVTSTIPVYVEILRRKYHATNAFLTPHGTFPSTAPVSQSTTPTPVPSNSIPGSPASPATPTMDASTAGSAGAPWLRDGHRVILAFGKFGTYKRIETLVDAYRGILASGVSDVDLVIAGTDAANTPGYLASVAAENDDLDGLIFTGYVAEEQVEPLFRGSTVMAFPYTSTTGSSGPLHQAGGFGVAPVLPAIGDFLEVIADEGFVAETFEPGDPFSLAEAIQRLLNDGERRAELVEQNRRAAQGLAIADVADWHLLHLEHLARTR